MSSGREKIGDYELRRCLYTGMSSQVYEVVEPRSGRHFAMKLLVQEQAGNKEFRSVLFHEAEVGIKLRHPNVINIISVSKSPTTPHFVMEYFPSGSLRARLTSKDPKDAEFVKQNARKIFKQVSIGLAYMNSSGFVHCDIKPDNIIVDASGVTKIIDFAISRKITKSAGDGIIARLFGGGKKKKVQGTYSFMSPEQIRNAAIDGRSDVYSFGATIFELVTGRPPFRGASIDEILKKHLSEKPVFANTINPDVTDQFSALVNKMLSKKREERPENFHVVLRELKQTRVFKSVTETDDEPGDY